MSSCIATNYVKEKSLENVKLSNFAMNFTIFCKIAFRVDIESDFFPSLCLVYTKYHQILSKSATFLKIISNKIW